MDPIAANPIPLGRRHLSLACAIFALALVLRLLFLFTSHDRAWPHSVHYEGDAVVWAKSADLMNRGQLPDEGLPTRFYAVAYVLHWLHPGGPIADFVPFKVLWCALSALSCAMAYLAFARMLRQRTALLATALCVFSFGSYVLATSINAEGLYVPLLVAILAGSMELLWRPKMWLAASLALLHGCALLVRGEHLLVLLLLVAHFLWQSRRMGEASRLSLSRRLRVAATVGLGAIVVCLPYAVGNTLATVRYNTIPKTPIDYDSVGVNWQPEARAFVETLPAFLRGKTVEHVSGVCRERSIGVVSEEIVRGIFTQAFGEVPEALSTPVFVASCGPMDFALANSPQAQGGFSKAALSTRFSNDPKLNLAFPGHLRIYNHGYAVGWGYIRSNFTGWLHNEWRKLGNAYEGASLGFTAYDLPYGRGGQRRAVDLVTPGPGRGTLWRLGFAALLVLGLSAIIRKHSAALPWLLVAVAKLGVILAFFGFARQAVSIFPILYLLVALGLEEVIVVLARLGLKPIPTRYVQIVPVVALILICGLEIQAARTASNYEVLGPTRPLPGYGGRAWSSNLTIELRASP